MTTDPTEPVLPPSPPSQAASSPRGSAPSRRQVLTWMAGAAAVGGSGLLAACSDGSSPGRSAAPATPTKATTTTTSEPPLPSAKVPIDERVLVVIDLVGGNDGLSMLVPHKDGRYRKARPSTGIPEDRLIDVGDDDYALNDALRLLHDQGLAVLDGIGAQQPTLSHFDMMARWYLGAISPTALPSTGWLGRICDRLGDERELVGVSINRTASLSVASAKRTTVTIPDAQAIAPLTGATPSSTEALERALAAMGRGSDDGIIVKARSGLDQMLSIDSVLATLPDVPGYQLPGGPGDTFMAQMHVASRLLHADLGLRVIHVPMGYGDFDTHDIHNHRYPILMTSFTEALSEFRRDLDAAGWTDKVLIATTSEFGRRLKENYTGLDHGTASCALLMGPVADGLHGEHPSLAKLDDNGDLFPTVSMTRYLGTLAAWLGIDPSDILPGDTEPISGVVAI